MPRAIEDPILAYTAAEGEINQIQWGATQPDWIAICYNKNLEILRVLFKLFILTYYLYHYNNLPYFHVLVWFYLYLYLYELASVKK